MNCYTGAKAMRGYRIRAGLTVGRQTAVAVFLFTIVLLVGRGEAGPLVIQPGEDGFVTQPGSIAPLPSLPAGFFGNINGTDSDATAAVDITVVSGPDLVALVEVTTFLTGEGCHGHAGQLNSGHCYEQRLETLVPIYDTVIQRSGGTIANEGDSLNASIEFVHLSLMSASPLEVTYGAEGSLLYDILVELDEEGGAQTLGTLALNRTTSFAGTMDTSLPVRYKVTFTEVDGARVFSLVEDSSQESDGNTWQVVVPTVSEWGMIVLVLLALTAGTVVFGRLRRPVAA